MDAISSFGDNAAVALGVLVFLAAGTLTFALMAGMRARQAVLRRAARLTTDEELSVLPAGLRQPGLAALRRLLDGATAYYTAADGKDVKVLRSRLVRAGIFNPQAPAYFFVGRTVLAVVVALVTFFVITLCASHIRASFWVLVMTGGVGGYLLPSLYLDKRIKARRLEHQSGFPDFMDLMVVCADAGLAMEAALERVARELGSSYPSLAANLHITNLEIRAGRSLPEALDHLADRLGLEEARSFANLVQQSEQMGSSIGAALRVYSDDTRHKRLSRAEEKAHSLPAKLAVPMMVCIFPVLFIVILTPVIVRLATGNW